MPEKHFYEVRVEWTGNLGQGTTDYRSYARDHLIRAEGKPPLPGSSDPVFRGDAGRYNPEELLVASLSACHMLWYLHLCAVNGVLVLEYEDRASGEMEERDGTTSFSAVWLRPRIKIRDAAMKDKAMSLHQEAGRKCFIANSVRFPVHHKPMIHSEERPASP